MPQRPIQFEHPQRAAARQPGAPDSAKIRDGRELAWKKSAAVGRTRAEASRNSGESSCVGSAPLLTTLCAVATSGIDWGANIAVCGLAGDGPCTWRAALGIQAIPPCCVITVGCWQRPLAPHGGSAGGAAGCVYGLDLIGVGRISAQPARASTSPLGARQVQAFLEEVVQGHRLCLAAPFVGQPGGAQLRVFFSRGCGAVAAAHLA